MRKYIGAVLLLAAGLMIASPVALAQDALSATIPAPWENRTGTQTIYTYEDGARGARGTYKAFLTVTNHSITTTAWIHVQVYTAACAEVFDFIDRLTPADTHIYDPAGYKRDWDGATVGSATDGAYVVTITVIQATPTPLTPPALNQRQAVSFNWLTGNLWQAHVGQEAASQLGAVTRRAVSPLGANLADSNVVLNGTTRLLQFIRPVIIALDSFFAPATLQQPGAGIPAGNRLAFVSFSDIYAPPDLTYRIAPQTTTLNSLLFDNEENVFSIPPRTVRCWSDFSVGFESGGFTNFIGSSVTPSILNTGGWIRSRPAYGAADVLYGWFFQSLGKFGGARYLVGIGRATPNLVTFPIVIDFNPVTGLVQTQS